MMKQTDRTNRTSRRTCAKHRQKQGFTIMEMLIVVAIIAVLVAIAIPTFNNSLHKAKVAADEANLRAYYAELQLEYMTTGEYRADIGDNIGDVKKEIVFADGTTVTMQAGSYMIIRPESGYQITYICDKYDCDFTWGI